VVPVGRHAEPAPTELASYRTLKGLMFPGQMDNNQKRSNSGLRTLDQSWRLRPQWDDPDKYRPEVILVARVAPLAGSAAEVTGGGATPTHLWLDQLPAADRQRPDLYGYLSQETYLRVYIPVRP
jgi:hypothetical protein